MIEFNGRELIERTGAPQENWNLYVEHERKTVSFPVPWAKRQGDVVPGVLDFQIYDWLQLARGNLRRRVMPGLMKYCELAESTVYEAINTTGAQEGILLAVELAAEKLLWSEALDLPTRKPTLDNLSDWLQQWVGTYEWIGGFIGVKGNTIASWLSRGSDDKKKQLLDFATRWYEARHALWREKEQEEYESEYYFYLIEREKWAANALAIATEFRDEQLRKEIEKWERTAHGQAYLEDVEEHGEEWARKQAMARNLLHPKDVVVLTLPVVHLNRMWKFGQKPLPPTKYEDFNKNSTRFGPPAPAEKLWLPAKSVDA